MMYINILMSKKQRRRLSFSVYSLTLFGLMIRLQEKHKKTGNPFRLFAGCTSKSNKIMVS